MPTEWRTIHLDQIASMEPAQPRLSVEELALRAGMSRATLLRLVRLGVIEPRGAGEGAFLAEEVRRLKRMMRLHRDLGVNFTGAAIIVDLLERLERTG